jgi:hypothetical protein
MFIRTINIAWCVAATACTVVLAESPEPTSVPAQPVLTVNKNVGTGEVVLSWSATTNPYSVARDTDSNPGDFTPIILTSGVAGTSFADPALNDGINYFYLLDDANTPTRVYGRSANAGLPGASITFTGVGFSTVLANNQVFIGGAQAIVTGATDTSLTFTVPSQAVTAEVVLLTPKGANLGGLEYVIGTDFQPTTAIISSLAVDSSGTKFVSTTGPDVSLSDRVFTFEPSTGARTQVALLAEATGLPNDEDGSPTNRVYYGNGTVAPTNAGRIERVRSGGAPALYRNCGVGTTDPCYPWGIGLDPDLTDFGADGRVYVLDGCTWNPGPQTCRTTNQEVLLVPPSGPIQLFASGFTFGTSPRGIVVDRDAGSIFHSDVYISDSTSVYRYGSTTVPGTLEMTYSPGTFPLVSPRQLALTPTNRVRLLVADAGQGRVVMINPDGNASKVINIPFNGPRAIAVEHDAGTNTNTAWVGEPTRVVKVPLHRTVYVSPWVAQGSGITDAEVRELVRYANSSLYDCGFEIQIRDDHINAFNPGALLDVTPYNKAGTMGCGDINFVRSQDEKDLVAAPRRSANQTDVNVYFVRKFTGIHAMDRIAEAITRDCFLGMIDETESGIIFSVERLRKSSTGGDIAKHTIWALGHELGHTLLNRNNWTPSTDEHLARNGASLPAHNIMISPAAVDHALFNDPEQCLNMNADATIFRGDP